MKQTHIPANASLQQRGYSIKSLFEQNISDKPYCCDDFKQMRQRDRITALGMRHIQPNQSLCWRWMVFDLDHDDAYFQPERRNCPEPNFISVNRSNGHAHVGYLLSSPVTNFTKSHQEPLRLFEDVERGLGKRLGADLSYNGLICKNPVSPSWETDWMASSTYELSRLNDYLDKSDKVKFAREDSAIGRNCSLFDSIRKVGYREVLKFKKDGRGFLEFRAFLEGVASQINLTFASPLWRQEVLGVVKSVSRWIWDEFSVAKFSNIQKQRIAKRWDGKSIEVLKPWLSEGISRRTWYSRKKAALP